MALRYDGAAAFSQLAAVYLSGSAGPFTITGYVRPANLTQGAGKILLQSGNASLGTVFWRLRWESVADSIDFQINGGGSGAPGTSSAIALTAAHTTPGAGAHFGYRYLGAGLEWSKWLDSVKTVINPAITFTLPALSGITTIGGDNAGNNLFNGGIAELALWTIALTDAEMAALGRGQTASTIARAALAVYWPLRGNQIALSAEADYSNATFNGGANILGLSGAEVQEQHPATYGPDLDVPDDDDVKAWVLDVFHADGTLRAATTDLNDPFDVDTLGGFYPRVIKNADSIAVVDQLPDIGSGVQLPSTVTLILDNSDWIAPSDIAGLKLWLEAENVVGIASGAPVAAWYDRSGSGNDATQATGANQPLYVPNVANGYAVLRFDGTNDGMGTPLVVNAAPYSVFVVYSYRSAVSIARRAVQGSNNWLLGPYNNTYQCFDGGFVAGSLAVTQNVFVVESVVVQGIGSFGTGLDHYTNGTLRGSNVPSTTPGTVALGASGGFAEPLNGDIAAVLVFSAALSDRDRRRIEAYLARKYGVAGPASFGVAPTREWRDVPAALRRYERRGHELVTELSGVIADAVFTPGEAQLTLTSHSAAVLNTLLPTLTIQPENDATTSGNTPQATDLGAALPVPFGASSFVTAPNIGRDDSNIGTDYALTLLIDSQGAALDLRVINIWATAQAGDGSGVEPATAFDPVVGTPVNTGTTTFTISGSGDLSPLYEVGMHIRLKTTASAGAYLYSAITAINWSGSVFTVTIADAIIGAGLANVEISGDYLLNRTQYQMNSKALLTLRNLLGVDGDFVAELQNNSYTNPADVLKEIFRNPDWGPGESVNAASFAAAATALTIAGLGSAVQGAIGGNRQRRRLEDIANEICAIYGIRLRLDGDLRQWLITADTTPAVADLSLEFGPGTANSLKTVPSLRRTPLADAVSVLTMNYRLGFWIPGTLGSLQSESYQLKLQATVLGSIGTERIVTSPWTRTFDVTKRMAARMAKELKFGDRIIEADGARMARRKHAGDLIHLRIPQLAIDSDWRIASITKSLADVRLTLRGYDPSIYVFSAGDVSAGTNTQTDTTDVLSTHSTPGFGNNLLANADYSAHLTSATVSGETVLPGHLLRTYTRFGAVTTVVDPACIGGHCLTVPVLSVAALDPQILCVADTTTRRGAIGVTPGKIYVFSVYADSPIGWEMRIYWPGTTTIVSALKMKSNPNDVNGKGWKRYYGAARAPNGIVGNIATSAYPAILFLQAVTRQFDAEQFELLSRRGGRPSQWKRLANWGVDPVMLQPGSLTNRAAGESELGTMRSVKTWTMTLPTGTNTSDSAVTAGDTGEGIEAGMTVEAVTFRVQAVIGGASTWNAGVAGANVRFTALRGLTVGTTGNSDTDHDGSFTTVPYLVNTPIRVTATSGNFNGTGTIKIAIHYTRAIPPTA